MKTLIIELEQATVCLDVEAIQFVSLDKNTGHVAVELKNGSCRTAIPSGVDEGASIYQDILIAMQQLENLEYSPNIQVPHTTTGPYFYTSETGSQDNSGGTFSCQTTEPRHHIDWDKLNREYQPGKPDVNFSSDKNFGGK